MKITTQRGDHILTKGLSEANYISVGKIFLQNGAINNNYDAFPQYNLCKQYKYFGVDNDNNVIHCNVPETFFGVGRQLSALELLGSYEFVPTIGEECEMAFMISPNYWEKVIPIAQTDKSFIYSQGDNEFMVHFGSVKFRNTMTERDIYSSELAKIVSVHHADLVKMINAILDAGYRNP